MKLSPKAMGWAVAAAAAVATPVIATWEGLRTDPYIDLTGKATICYGETRVEMRPYSEAECLGMLRQAVEGFAGEVLNCTPRLAMHPYQLAAATSLAYNIGAAKYCKSTAAQRFNAGDLHGGCRAFAMFNGATFTRPKPGHECRQKEDGRWFCVIPGLVNRRADEMQLCMVGLS